MKAIGRRLRKLELCRLTDCSGLIAHSAEWLDHWFGKADAIMSGKEPGTPGCIPLR